MIGLCPKCLDVDELTKHHILPKRHFPVSPESPLLWLCRGCHDQLEQAIPFHRQRTDFYFAIAIAFLKGEIYESRSRRRRNHSGRYLPHAPRSY